MDARPLTDAEDARLKDLYPAIWMKTARRPDLVSRDPITLRLWVRTPESMCLIPVDVKGFAIDLELDNAQENDMAGSGDRPEYIDQKGPSPGQGTLQRTSPQKDVPYKSGAATPKKSVK